MSDVAERGFTLLEIVCVLAIIALLAAVLLPFIPHETSRSRLQAYALQTAALLKTDRNAAIRRQASVATLVDAEARAIRSGACCRRPAAGRRCRPSVFSPTAPHVVAPSR
jgi:general secretion pathway protein H